MKAQLAMLAAVAGVAMAASAQATAFTETFDSAPVGAIGNVSGFYSTGAEANVAAGAGVAGTQGVGPGDQAFNWTARTFDWSSMTVGTAVVFGADYQSTGSGTFDDDRMGWATNATSSSNSSNHFGAQLDTVNGGFVTYWKNSGTNNSVIMLLPSITANTWYRARTTITKLGATAAKLDVSFQELDASGSPTGTLYTGSLADTSAVSNGPTAAYFSGTLSPVFKNFVGFSGGLDNVYFQDPAGVPEPASLSLLGLGALTLVRRRRA